MALVNEGAGSLSELGSLPVILAYPPKPSLCVSVEGRPYDARQDGAVARCRGQWSPAGASGRFLVVSETRVVLGEVAVSRAVGDEGMKPTSRHP